MNKFYCVEKNVKKNKKIVRNANRLHYVLYGLFIRLCVIQKYFVPLQSFFLTDFLLNL